MYKPEGCPFCDLGNRSLKKNLRADLILSNPRKVEGHFLVIPNRHVEDPSLLFDTEIIDIYDLINFAGGRLIATFGGGYDTRQNYRPFMPQGRLKVDHVHFHVYPRTLNDQLYQQVERLETDLFVDLPDEERARMTAMIKGEKISKLVQS